MRVSRTSESDFLLPLIEISNYWDRISSVLVKAVRRTP